MEIRVTWCSAETAGCLQPQYCWSVFCLFIVSLSESFHTRSVWLVPEGCSNVFLINSRGVQMSSQLLPTYLLQKWTRDKICQTANNCNGAQRDMKVYVLMIQYYCTLRFTSVGEKASKMMFSFDSWKNFSNRMSDKVFSAPFLKNTLKKSLYIRVVFCSAQYGAVTDLLHLQHL